MLAETPLGRILEGAFNKGFSMKWASYPGFIFALIGVLLLASCSGPSTSVTGVKRVDYLPNAPYANVLVIGVSKNPGTARLFANALAAELTNEKTTALPNHTENDADVLTEQQVREIVNKMQADAVVVSSVKHIDIGTSVEKSRTDVERTRKNESLVDFFRYDYKEVATPEIISLDYKVELTTDVYDALTGDKIYTIESSTMHAETSFEVIVSETAAIAKQLRKGGLVR